MSERVITGGIVGVTGREPIGAAIAIGIKGDRGFPVEKDRLHIVVPVEDANGKRPHHPEFARFNAAPIDVRRIVHGVIAHASWDACLEQRYQSYRLPKPLAQAPNKQPTCTGNGVTANRYHGERDGGDWRQIPCPGEGCPFRQPDGKNPALCKPFTRLLFRLDWPTLKDRPLPTPLVKLSSGGWHTYRAILGLKEGLDAAAEALGVADYSPIGLRFQLQLVERTSGTSRFPVLVASMMESAPDFLARSLTTHADLRRLAAALPKIGDDELTHSLPGDAMMLEAR